MNFNLVNVLTILIGLIRIGAALQITNHSAIQILEPTKDHKFLLNITEFEQILNNNEIRDRHVVVISIAGVARMGKSFLLNFLLEYLRAQVNSKFYKKKTKKYFKNVFDEKILFYFNY